MAETTLLIAPTTSRLGLLVLPPKCFYINYSITVLVPYLIQLTCHKSPDKMSHQFPRQSHNWLNFRVQIYFKHNLNCLSKYFFLPRPVEVFLQVTATKPVEFKLFVQWSKVTYWHPQAKLVYGTISLSLLDFWLVKVLCYRSFPSTWTLAYWTT